MPPDEIAPAESGRSVPESEADVDVIEGAEDVGRLVRTVQRFSGPVLGLIARHVDKDVLMQGMADQRHERGREHHRFIVVACGLFVAFFSVLGFSVFLVNTLAASNPALLTDIMQIGAGFLGGTGAGVIGSHLLNAWRRGSG